MNRFYAILFSVSLILVSMNALSGEVYDAKVAGILVSKVAVSVKTEGGVEYEAQPGCATGSFPWSIAVGSPEASTMLSLLLVSKSSGQKIRIVGTGSCSVQSNKEDVMYMILVDGRE